MTIEFNNYLFPILIGIIVLLILIIFIGAFCFIIPMKKQIKETNRIMFFILQKDDKYDRSHDDIKRGMNTLNSNMGLLSNSVNTVLEELIKKVNKPPKKRLPKPDESKLIRDTILECINMEVLLSKDMRIPNKQSTKNIIETTVETYPEIDVSYIVKLSMAMIENFVLDVKDDK